MARAPRAQRRKASARRSDAAGWGYSGMSVRILATVWAAAGSLFTRSLAPARYRNAKQESHEQACQRSFPGDGADGGERFAGLSGVRYRFAQPIDRGLERGGNLRDRARYIGCGIDGALGHARLGGGHFDVRILGVHGPMLAWLRTLGR